MIHPLCVIIIYTFEYYTDAYSLNQLGGTSMADPMKDPRVEMLRAAMTQRGRGMPIQVFRGTSRYQYGSGVGDVLKSIWKFIFPVIARGASSFLRYGGEALTTEWQCQGCAQGCDQAGARHNDQDDRRGDRTASGSALSQPLSHRSRRHVTRTRVKWVQRIRVGKAVPATSQLSGAVIERCRTEYINVPASEHVQSTIRRRISQTTTSKPLSNG